MLLFFKSTALQIRQELRVLEACRLALSGSLPLRGKPWTFSLSQKKHRALDHLRAHPPTHSLLLKSHFSAQLHKPDTQCLASLSHSFFGHRFFIHKKKTSAEAPSFNTAEAEKEMKVYGKSLSLTHRYETQGGFASLSPSI